MDTKNRAGGPSWDPYAVWQILLHNHPVRIEDPAASCGRIDGDILAEFFEAMVGYPDYLVDALLIIAHAEGFEAAVDALDAAIRELRSRQQ